MSTSAKLILGVDGGGSRTDVAVMDLARGVMAHVRGAPCAVIGPPTPATCAILVSLVDTACARLGARRAEIGACAIGLSGIDFADEHPAQRAALADALGFAIEPRALVNDGIIALWGATSSPASAILQHGTAITSAWRAQPGGETSFDHLDTGRQFELRAEAAVMVARMIDGRVPVTPLRDAVLAHCGVEADAFHEVVYRRRAVAAIASLAPVVFAAWEAGDAAATNLMGAARADYVQTAATMALATGSATPFIAFGGGVLKGAPARWHRQLETALHARCPGAIVGRPAYGPERGALVMAAFHSGLDAADAYTRVEHATVGGGAP